MSKTARSEIARLQCLAFSIFVASAILFIIIAFGVKMLNTKASLTFTATTVDNEVVEILILTDTPYSEKVWKRIEQSVKTAATLTNYEGLYDVIYGVMNAGNWSTLNISISKKVYKVK